MLFRPHLCSTPPAADQASLGIPGPMRPVVAIGRVRPTSVIGFCRGCALPELPKADRASEPVRSSSTGKTPRLAGSAVSGGRV